MQVKKLLPSQEYLQECFRYDLETGKLYWKQRPPEHFKTIRGWKTFNSQFPGKVALNSPGVRGYLTGSLNDIRVYAHRVIYKLLTGEEPNTIDHEYGITCDNKFQSITNGSQTKNMRNQKKRKDNSSGVTGVYWLKRDKCWIAKINNEGKSITLGYFKNKEDAIDTRKQAEVEYGYHPNHGRDLIKE
ncbi:hypothetical protein D3C87_324170 [compost metagenome]